MLIEKTGQGAWRICAIVNNQLIIRQYFYYTKREAIALFKEVLKAFQD